MLWKNTTPCQLLEHYFKIKNNEIFNNYYLVGGTALSLQIGHRESVDIDLFTLNKQDNEIILKCLKEIFKNVSVENNENNILQVIADDIKIDIVSAKGILIDSPKTEENITFCGIKDISGMKLSAIQDRKKAKDYIDIAYLIKELSLKSMFEIYKIKYPNDNIENVKKELLNSSGINAYEWYAVKMFKNDIEIFNIPKYIKEEIDNYNKICYNNKEELKSSIILTNMTNGYGNLIKSIKYDFVKNKINNNKDILNKIIELYNKAIETKHDSDLLIFHKSLYINPITNNLYDNNFRYKKVFINVYNKIENILTKNIKNKYSYLNKKSNVNSESR